MDSKSPYKLHHMNGGMRMEAHKAESMQQPLQQATLAERLILPLKQHIGETNKPLVSRETGYYVVS